MSGKPEFFVAADLHLSAGGAWRHRGIKGDAEYSFQQIVDACVKRKPRALILLGDLLEAREVEADTPDLHLFLQDQFLRLAKADVPVLYVLGNHDLGIDWPRIHRRTRHVDGTTFWLDGFDDLIFYGLDWTPRGKLAARLKEIPEDVSVLVAHQEWKELINQRSDMIEPEASFADLPGHITTVLSGDYHRRRVVSWTRPDGSKVDGYSPGSTSLQTINEDREKSFLAFRQGGGGIVGEEVRLDTRRVSRDAEMSSSPLPEHLRRPILEVTFNVAVPEAHARLVAACEERTHLFLKPCERPGTVRVVSDAARREIAKRGLAGVIAALARDRPAVRDGALRLLEAADPAAELEAMKDEFLGER